MITGWLPFIQYHFKDTGLIKEGVIPEGYLPGLKHTLLSFNFFFYYVSMQMGRVGGGK